MTESRIRQVRLLNKREAELGIEYSGSWHYEYRDSAYVYIGGLDPSLNEGDVIVVFSQFGEVVDINLSRDPQTGKSRGFCFLAYEDQRSTVLAVDNMNGAILKGRTVNVDHKKDYKRPVGREDLPEEEREKRAADYDEKQRQVWNLEEKAVVAQNDPEKDEQRQLEAERKRIARIEEIKMRRKKERKQKNEEEHKRRRRP